jgi:hypothetical protein
MIGDTVDQGRLTFHPDFLYKHQYWRSSIILVSDEGTHFHVRLRLLIRHSTVFADATSIPTPEYTAIEPVTLTFAPTSALAYVLTLLRDWDRGSHAEITEIYVTQKAILAAARIAHVLDMPIVGKIILASQDLDVYMRYAIERMVDSLEGNAQALSKPTNRGGGGTDLSFSLYPHGQYRRAHDLLSEASPSTIDRLAKFHARRKTALAVLRQWWTTGEPLGRVLRSDHSPSIAHKSHCKAKHDSKDQLRRDAKAIATKALTALAGATTTGQRSKRVIEVVAAKAGGCRGCLARLEAVYMPALRVFNASFPASP